MRTRRSGGTNPQYVHRLLHPLSAVVCCCTLAVPAAAQDVDVTPPVLVDFTFSPMVVDVSTGPALVTAAVQATDDLAGIANVIVSFRSPSFAQFQNANLLLTAGTRLDGTFVGNVSIPQFAEAGIWTVSGISMTDLAGNNTFLNTAFLISLGLPTQLTVTSVPDTEAPMFAGIAVAPGAIDVSAGPQVVTVDLHLTDNLSGTAFSAAACAGGQFFAFFATTWRSPSGAQNRYTPSQPFMLVSGTPADGVWRSSFTMPQFSEPGDWTLQSVQARDCAGNNRNLNAVQLVAMGLQVTLPVTSVPADVQPPLLTSLSFSPITINTSTGPQLVRVQLGMRDDLSGVAVTPTTPNLSFFERGVQFRSPSGNQFRSAAFFSQFTLVSGTVLDGIWEATIGFPQFSEDGTWRIDLLQIKDAVRNIATFNTATLDALGLPTRLEVIRPSLEVDGSVDEGGGTVEDDTFGDRASITFPPGALTGPTDVAIDVFLEPLDIPNPSGFSGPGTLFVNIDLQPQPSFPLPPPGMTIVLPMPDPLPAGTVLSLFRVDPVTGALVPAIDVFGMDATGTVNADGLSATFTGVASLSTVVGMIPETLTVTIDIRPGSSPNAVNLGSRGVLPVAILSTATFDARTVVPASVTLAGASARVRPNGQPMFSIEDVNGDGLPDLVLHIETQALQLTSDSTEAVLHGVTTTGMAITGRDSVRIVP